VLAALCTSDLVTLSLHDALPILFPLECRRKLRRLGVAISRQRVANWLRKKFFRFPSWEPARKGGESKNWRMTMPDARVGRLKVAPTVSKRTFRARMSRRGMGSFINSLTTPRQ